MGYRELTIKLPTDFHENDIRKVLSKKLNISDFSYQIDHKSLDARKKWNIHWQLRLGIFSDEIKSDQRAPERDNLQIDYKKRSQNVVVVGSGPAGFFAGYTLQKAGFNVTIIDRGNDVTSRTKKIEEFESRGRFSPTSNYAFGEGGAGTFSDGKLTSRSKHISKERNFILDTYIEAGAPEEIKYLTHPHVGSDNLIQIVYNLREKFKEAGGQIKFETMLNDIITENGKITEIATNNGHSKADYLVMAPGHSSYETYHLLLRAGVKFRTKNFALGYRIEHPQKVINMAQWGKEKLPGVKAAEYRLTYKNSDRPVYTFCMCPGGMVVPSTAYPNKNTVNGMSLYQRDGEFANSACVAGVHPDELLGKEATPEEILNYVSDLENKFYDLTGGFNAPACSIESFIDKKDSFDLKKSSYPFKLHKSELWNQIPEQLSNAIRYGLLDFSKKLPDFNTGMLIGLESKTSSPIQVIREKDGRCTGFENMFMVGEGSGYAGGIISSAADGVKVAMNIVEQS